MILFVLGEGVAPAEVLAVTSSDVVDNVDMVRFRNSTVEEGIVDAVVGGTGKVAGNV